MKKEVSCERIMVSVNPRDVELVRKGISRAYVKTEEEFEIYNKLKWYYFPNRHSALDDDKVDAVCKAVESTGLIDCIRNFNQNKRCADKPIDIYYNVDMFSDAIIVRYYTLFTDAHKDCQYTHCIHLHGLTPKHIECKKSLFNNNVFSEESVALIDGKQYGEVIRNISSNSDKAERNIECYSDFETLITNKINTFCRYTEGDDYGKIKQTWIRNSIESTGLFNNLITQKETMDGLCEDLEVSHNIFNIETFNDKIYLHYGYTYEHSHLDAHNSICIHCKKNTPLYIESRYCNGMDITGIKIIPLKFGLPHGVVVSKEINDGSPLNFNSAYQVDDIQCKYEIEYYSNGVRQERFK